MVKRWHVYYTCIPEDTLRSPLHTLHSTEYICCMDSYGINQFKRSAISPLG